MSKQKSILLVEPRIEGHHLRYLQYLCEDFLALGFHVSLALDMRSDEARNRLSDKNPDLVKRCALVSLYTTLGIIKGGSLLAAATMCMNETHSDEVFFNSFDEVSSKMIRRACFFSFPFSSLKGKISGIYFRPRQLDKGHWSLNKMIKQIGFNRLYNRKWFKYLFLANEFLVERVKAAHTGDTFHFLPDPSEPFDIPSKVDARKKLGVPGKRKVLLHFGAGTRRKGLLLLLKAFDASLAKDELFLIVAGKQESDPQTKILLARLEQEGCLKLLNYYVSDAEEKLCFSATDFVMLPYLSHYGSTNVLARAAAAQRPVIASDYHLVGRRVLAYKLGILFENQKIESLKRHLEEAAVMSEERYQSFIPGLKSYAEAFSREAFRKALAEAYQSD